MVIRFSDLISLKQRQSSHQKSLSPEVVSIAISLIVAACMILLNSTGCFQVLEWLVFDSYFRLRPETESVDPRILIVTIDEPDLSQLQQWPLSDRRLAQALTQVSQHAPRVIGLDIYRDFSVPPGTAALETAFKDIPDLFGVEKVGETPVPPPPILAKQNRVAMADILMDNDGKVRRALFTTRQQGEIRMSLGTAVALHFLKHDGIVPHPIPGSESYRLKNVVFPRLQSNDGGYTHADNRGYQTILNFRGPDNQFETVSIIDVLEGQVSEDLIRDRIVLIGSIAPSLNDFVYTPYGTSHLTDTLRSPGIAIHAHIASQIVSAVLDGRPLIRTWPTEAEWGWVLLWCGLGSGLIMMQRSQMRSGLKAFLSLMIPILGLSFSVFIINGLWFFNGWWVPSLPALLGLITSAIIGLTTSNLRLIKDAYVDGLTNVLNRRAFNQHIADAQRNLKDIAIILCDVDFFKNFNDFYGHPAGDECLQKVAKAIQQAVRPQDIVARYGGEEFAVILQVTSTEKACEIAERMREKVNSCQIPHAQSQVSSHVSISCGVAMYFADSNSSLIKVLTQADKALYRAKRAGRNKIALFNSDQC